MLKKIQIFLVIGFLFIGTSSTYTLADFIAPKDSIQIAKVKEADVNGKIVLASAPIVRPAKPVAITPAPMSVPTAKQAPGGVQATPKNVKKIPRPAPRAQITTLQISPSNPRGLNYLYQFGFINNGMVELSGLSVKPYVLTKVGRSYLLNTVNYPQMKLAPGQAGNGKEPFTLTKVPQKAIKDINAFQLEIWYSGKKLASKRVPFAVKANSSNLSKLSRTGAAKDIETTPAAQATTAAQAAISVKPQIADSIAGKKPQLMKAELTDLQIGTEADGRWYWEATITNSGTGTVASNIMTVQGVQTGFGRSNEKAASGSNVAQSIAPNQSTVVKRYWTRCCRSKDLSVDLKMKQSNLILGTQSVTNMISTPGNIFGSKLKVININWDATQKKWQATIRNTTPYSIKLIVQGYRLAATGGPFVPAGGTRIVAAANTETTTHPLLQTDLLDGDKLKVALIFDESSNYCSDWDSPRDCGAERGNITTIPNSADFQ